MAEIRHTSNPGAVRVGVVFPQTEIGADRSAIEEYAFAVQELGFKHILAYDHVLGADPQVHSPWRGPYDIDTTFHEPLVLFGFLSALTNLELVSGIIILPQRQSALLAKQAAEVDLLCGGHLRLGVGLGWNPVEYQALGKSFSNRGARISEQVELMRALWTQRSVTFQGRFEQVSGAGICPAPIQRPIPIWFGAMSEPALRRAGSIADGWFPRMPPGPELQRSLAHLHQGAKAAGRDPKSIGIEGRITLHPSDPGSVVQQALQWRQLEASHLCLSTMGLGLRAPQEHVALLAQASQALQDAGVM